MAHLAILHDADRDRRERFAAGVRSLFGQLPGTVVGEARSGPLICIWVHGPNAPFDIHREDDTLAVLLGYAVDDAGRWLSARELTDAWLAPDAADTAQDGYYVGLAWDPARGLAAGVDPLGLFPLYQMPLPTGGYLVATTPEAFLQHPDVPWQVDRLGLAGVLLAHGLLDNRPLLAGAERIRCGHRLRAPPDRPPSQVEVFRMEGTPPPPGETFAAAERRMNSLLSETLRRHRPPGDDTLLMLSGGLDSRLVAGSLADLGIPTRAVSFGQPRDHEVLAAKAVAARLGLPLETISTEDWDDAFVGRTRRAARLSHLASGPGGDDFLTGLHAAATTARYHWSGVPFDWALEPVSKHNGYDAVTGTWSFDALLAMVNSWGVPVDRLPGLLGADGGDLCGHLITSLEDACTAGPLPPERQSAVLRWDQRIRNHLAAALHETTFAAWPLLPATDRRFFQAAFGMPLAAYRDRRIEKAMLLARCPRLAAIPLDTNSFSFAPLPANSEARRGLADQLASLFGKARRAVQPLLPRSDPRRYERLFNVDLPRWQALRQAAEPFRPRLAKLLDPKALAATLPPPDRAIRSRRPLIDGSPIRLLLGLALLLDR
jgi:asparagine synthase (glutamine-hydrolysing)